MKCALPGCEIEFIPHHKRQRFCCEKHQVKWNNQQHAAKKGVKPRYESQIREPAPRLKSEPYQPTPRRQIMTDAQQRKIDAAVAKKHAVKLEPCRSLKGAEFRRVAAELIEREQRECARSGL